MRGKKSRGLGFMLLIAFLVISSFSVVMFFLIKDHNVAILNPAGLIAGKERTLMITTVLLALLVVIPVFSLAIAIAWRYREGNHKAKYTPDWDHNFILELIWWGIPIAIILVLSVITWQSSHELDPFRGISSDKKPINIQVVALDWKWLFIYPDQNIASVNYVQFPKDTPINFQITSDAPMNSFWIPQLGGQIYAMPGMSTQLHLLADKVGNFQGSSSNISGRGFAGMKFTARASNYNDFSDWVDSVKAGDNQLDTNTYQQLAMPSENNQLTTYGLVQKDLYDTIISKYMLSGHDANINNMQEGMHY